jgi:hypothetical protein
MASSDSRVKGATATSQVDLARKANTCTGQPGDDANTALLRSTFLGHACDQPGQLVGDSEQSSADIKVVTLALA